MDNIAKICSAYVKATQFHSRRCCDIPEYQAVISLGNDAIPHILQLFVQERISAHWFPVLEELTNVNPLPPQPLVHEGKEIPGWVGINVSATAEAWVKWGRDNGHLPRE